MNARIVSRFFLIISFTTIRAPFDGTVDGSIQVTVAPELVIFVADAKPVEPGHVGGVKVYVLPSVIDAKLSKMKLEL